MTISAYQILMVYPEIEMHDQGPHFHVHDSGCIPQCFNVHPTSVRFLCCKGKDHMREDGAA